jgi:hypothetical protein
MESFSNQINIGSYTSVTIDVEGKRHTRDSDTTVLDRQDRFIWPVRNLDMYESGISYIQAGYIPFHGVLEGIPNEVEYDLFLRHVNTIKHGPIR